MYTLFFERLHLIKRIKKPSCFFFNVLAFHMSSFITNETPCRWLVGESVLNCPWTSCLFIFSLILSFSQTSHPPPKQIILSYKITSLQLSAHLSTPPLLPAASSPAALAAGYSISSSGCRKTVHLPGVAVSRLRWTTWIGWGFASSSTCW